MYSFQAGRIDIRIHVLDKTDGRRGFQETQAASTNFLVHPLPPNRCGNLTASSANNERKRQFERLHDIHPAQGVKEAPGEAVCDVLTKPDDKPEFRKGAGYDCAEGRFDGDEEVTPEQETGGRFYLERSKNCQLR